MPRILPTLARNLAKMRKDKGFTQAEFAKAAGTSRSVIARYESGRGGLDMKKVATFAKILGVEETDLVDENSPLGLGWTLRARIDPSNPMLVLLRKLDDPKFQAQIAAFIEMSEIERTVFLNYLESKIPPGTAIEIKKKARHINAAEPNLVDRLIEGKKKP